MLTIFNYEWKNGFKNFIIWTLLVGGLGFVCMLLYQSMQDSISEMADSFSSMGSFSDAFGMSTLSIATVTGYFATEIGTIHGLGSGMYAASVATIILSKEEDSHTAEFTYSLPLRRSKVVTAKLAYVVTSLIAFHAVCGIIYQCGFMIMDENTAGRELLLFIASQLFMNVEIALVCFLISACSKKNKPGIGIGLSLLFYLFDIMGRISPDLKKIIFLTPYSYANASEIFAKKWDGCAGLFASVIVILLAAAASYIVYNGKDIAS